MNFPKSICYSLPIVALFLTCFTSLGAANENNIALLRVCQDLFHGNFLYRKKLFDCYLVYRGKATVSKQIPYVKRKIHLKESRQGDFFYRMMGCIIGVVLLSFSRRR